MELLQHYIAEGVDLFLSGTVACRGDSSDSLRSLGSTLDDHILGLELVDLLGRVCVHLVAEVLGEGQRALVLVLGWLCGRRFRGGTVGRMDLLHGDLDVVDHGRESLN